MIITYHINYDFSLVDTLSSIRIIITAAESFVNSRTLEMIVGQVNSPGYTAKEETVTGEDFSPSVTGECTLPQLPIRSRILTGHCPRKWILREMT